MDGWANLAGRAGAAVIEVDGDWRQLNTNLLQIENEFYSFVRPKQIAESGEKPTLALQRRGVAYVEIRALDVDVNHPLGLSEATLRFMEIFLILCTLTDSAELDDKDRAEIEQNQRLAACCGRQPGLALHRDGEAVPLRDWGMELCEVMVPIAEVLDEADGGERYRSSLRAQQYKLEDPESTPSAQILQTLRDRGESFFEYTMGRSRDLADAFRGRPLPDSTAEEYRALAEASLLEQRDIESTDAISFERYLSDYFAQTL